MKGNLILVPKKKPKTVRDVVEWHKKLLFECLQCELEKQIIEKSISELNHYVQETSPFLEDEVFKNAAKLKLQSVNKLLKKAREDLLLTKTKIEMLHNTNETIIARIIASCGGEKEVVRLHQKYEGCHPNLLHGIGWMFEYEVAKQYWAKGMPAFLTFGSFMDPAKVDVIAISQSMDENIRLNL